MGKKSTGSGRGFASLDAKRRSEISSQGGKAAHAAGTAHTFAKGEEAIKAGRKGGKAPHVSRGRPAPVSHASPADEEPTVQ